MIKAHTIGIVGGSASGKTTILNELLHTFSRNEVVLISQDNYYHPRDHQQKDENGEINFDLPSAINMAHFARDIASLKSGKSISKAEYTFNNPDKEAALITIAPAPIILIEGLFVFHNTEVDKQLDYRVYIDCPEEARLLRRIKRDSVERGYPESDVRYRWKHHVRPADIAYLEPHKERVDLLINNGQSPKEGLSQLETYIKSMLSL